MKHRAFGIALTVAMIGGAILFFYMKRFEDEASGGGKVAVLLVVKAVESGSTLKEENLGERMIPQAYVDPRSVRVADKTRVLGIRVAGALQAQQPLLWTDVSLASDGGRSVSSVLQPGMRAFTLHADAKSTAFVGPGDRIDVVGTFDLPSGPKRQTNVLLQNLLVIGRGGSAQTAASCADANDIAVSVTIQQAQMLVLANKSGDLSVILRGSSFDEPPVEHPQTMDPSILIDVAPPAPRPVVQKPHQPTILK